MTRRVLAATLAALVVVGVPASATAQAGEPLSGGQIRAAKVGWSRFVAANFAAPTAIIEPCPLLPAEAAAAHVTQLGLVPSDLDYGVSLYRDSVAAAGIVGITCGVDLARAASPPGATGLAIEVTVLDGLSEFPQYVRRVSGNQDTAITPAPELGGLIASRCRFDPTVCVATWHSHGLVITVKLDGPRTDDSDAHTRQLLTAVVPEIVASLAAMQQQP